MAHVHRADGMVDTGVVHIGKKPTMNYVLAVVTHFNSGFREVVLKATGRSISRAADVAEIVRGRFIADAEVRDVRIATEKIQSEDGRATNVSTIEIVLSK
jgi:DNA-binding protein